MTPAVTAIVLMRFARVEMSTSAWIGNTTKEKADTAGDVLDRIDEWPIDFHFDWFWFRPSHRRRSHHDHRGGCGRFRSLFINCDESFVKDIGDVEIIIRLPRRDFLEIRAASWNIERAFHSKGLEFFRQCYRRRLEFELWQMKIDFLSRFELCTFRQHACSQLRFERAQTIYVVGNKNEELKIVANVGKAYRDESLALGETKRRLLIHRWNIDGRAPANMKWLGLCCLFRK